MTSVKVAVRTRPFNKRELEMNSEAIIRMEGNTTQLTNTKLPNSGNESFGREKIKNFTYDYSYWSVDENDHNYTSQEMIFKDLGEEVVESAYHGYNACVFAYGQTGSGKTYTMMGSQDNEGLTPRVCEVKSRKLYQSQWNVLDILQCLFSRMTEPGTTYQTQVSYLEIYNERVRDLLQDKNKVQLNLKVREHPKEGPYVQDLSRHSVLSYKDIERLLNVGTQNRTTASTNMNDQSSRSHAIFTILFTQAKFSAEVPSEVHSKIHLVDLAGSERATSAGTSGDRLKEGGNINKSLVTLGSVISSLAELSEKEQNKMSMSSTPRSTQRSVFIPYRDSVLTWLLKDSLGGNARTIMIATVSPADCQYAETLSTLRYARRAKMIVNKPIVNEDPNVRLIRELRAENARLKALLAELGKKEPPSPVEVVEEAEKKLTRNEEKVVQLMETWASKWSEAANILNENQTLALRREGSGVVLDSALPYLLCMDDHILSTGMRFYHLKEGETTFGNQHSAKDHDIVLEGRCIEADHCIIKHENDEVTLIPQGSSLCSVNNVRIHQPTRLCQGSVIRLGRNHVFRFNHPSEVARLREQMKKGLCQEATECFRNRQWTWSTVSMTDSAVGSDFGDVEEACLDAKKRELDRLELDHCLAEARRVEQMVKLEANQDELKKKEQEVQTLTQDAERKLRTLSANLECEYHRLLTERCSLDKDRQRLDDSASALQSQRLSAGSEIRRTKRLAELDKMKAELMVRRQLIEWMELETERKHLSTLRENDEASLNKHKERINSLREIERKIWKEDLTEMRELMLESELSARASVAAWADAAASIENFNANQSGNSDDFCTTESTSTISADQSFSNSTLYDIDDDLGLRPPTEGVENDDDDSFNIESLRLVLPKYCSAESCLPAEYLEPSVKSQDLEQVFKSTNGWMDEEEGQDIGQLVSQLAEQVHSMHVHVCTVLQRKYSSVLREDDQTELLKESAVSLSHHIKPLYVMLEKLTIDHGLDPLYGDRLKDYDRLLTVADSFVKMHSCLQSAAVDLSRQLFHDVIHHIDEVQEMISALDVEDPLEVSTLKCLQTELCVRRESLLFELGEAWNSAVRWTLPAPRRLAAKPSSVSTLSLRCNNSDLRVIADAMSQSKMLESRLKTFVDRLLVYIISALVEHDDTELEVKVEGEGEGVTIRCVMGSSGTPTSPAIVFKSVEKTVEILNDSFGHVAIRRKKNSREEECLMTWLSRLAAGKVYERLYSGCVAFALPVDGSQWDVYSRIASASETFQQSLAQLGFIPANNEPTLMDYLNNVNSLFATAKSREILRLANELMTSELTNMTQVSADKPLGQEPPCCEELSSVNEEYVWRCREEAGTIGYKLPTCKVSTMVCNVVRLAYATLHEVQGGSQEVAYQLCCAVQNLFELFSETIPAQHADKIAAVPLVAALHHNNCMYLVHHMITIDKCLNLKLMTSSNTSSASSPLSSLSSSMTSLYAGGAGVAEVGHSVCGSELLRVGGNEKGTYLQTLMGVIRGLGNESFSQHVRLKQEQLRDFLEDLTVFECIADDNGNDAMKMIKGLLYHLGQISSVWVTVLPTNVYCRSMGRLMNVALNEMIDSVMSIEEFSADDCSCLQKVLSHLVSECVTFFKSIPANNTQHVESSSAHSEPKHATDRSEVHVNNKEKSHTAGACGAAAESFDDCRDSGPEPRSVSSEASAVVLTHEFVQNWTKLKELTALLPYKLDDVSDRWSEGKGPLALHFTGDQVASLVIAMFEKTSKRDQLVAQLRKHKSVHLY